MAHVPRTTFTLTAIAAVVVGGVGLGTGPAAADSHTAALHPAAACAWDGAAHHPGATVIAGGREYRCGADNLGAPYWFAGASTDRHDTVTNPGARTDPAGRFSAGARQPGTSYNDYCSGYQLIPGTEDIYQVVRASDGRLFWKAAGPVSGWQFGAGTARPEATWRTGSLCYDGNMA